MWLDLVALILLTAFAALGAWRGWLATALGLATLLLSYLAALHLGPALAPALAESLGVSTLWALPLAGTGAFLTSYVLLGFAAWGLRRLAGGSNGERDLRDRFLGGCFGAARGLLLVLLVTYLALWVDALRSTGTVPGLPALGESRAATLTGEVVESGLEAALGGGEDSGARVAARIAARPGVAIAELQGVIDSPEIADLRSDAMFWTYVEHGSIDVAMSRGSFQRVVGSDVLRGRLASLGLVPDIAESDPVAFRDAVAEVLHEVGPRIRGLKEDPALQQLMEDPEVIAMLQSGDTLGLLGHPGVQDLVARVSARSGS